MILVIVGGAMLVDVALERRWMDFLCGCSIAYMTTIFVLEEFADARSLDRR